MPTSQETVTYLEFSAQEGLREQLPKEVVESQYVFMYSDYDVERAKFGWTDIVKSLKKVTAVRAVVDAKRQGKGEDKRKKWVGLHVPELPDELME